MTYNVTQANMHRAEKQIKELTEMNVNHKEEIKRLKNQLSSYERPKPPTPQKSIHNRENEEMLVEIQEYRETQNKLMEQLENSASQIEKLTM